MQTHINTYIYTHDMYVCMSSASYMRTLVSLGSKL